MRRLDLKDSPYFAIISPHAAAVLDTLPEGTQLHLRNELLDVVDRAPALSVSVSMSEVTAKVVTLNVDGYLALCRIEPARRRVTLTDVARWLDAN